MWSSPLFYMARNNETKLSFSVFNHHFFLLRGFMTHFLIFVKNVFFSKKIFSDIIDPFSHKMYVCQFALFCALGMNEKQTRFVSLLKTEIRLWWPIQPHPSFYGTGLSLTYILRMAVHLFVPAQPLWAPSCFIAFSVVFVIGLRPVGLRALHFGLW